MKILNLYSGIGGNRKYWGGHEITAIEINPEIAKIYQGFFPQDNMIIDDAHDYLLEHYQEYDFIWSSPPCPTHSKTIYFNHIKLKYPDMRLYEEIIFLQHFYKGIWVIENVKSYYRPLIKPQETERHYFWGNFKITPLKNENKKVRNDRGCTLTKKMEEKEIIIKDFYGYKGDKRTLLNNAIEPLLGLHILECGIKEKNENRRA